jgi:hypothetical protein
MNPAHHADPTINLRQVLHSLCEHAIRESRAHHVLTTQTQFLHKAH